MDTQSKAPHPGRVKAGQERQRALRAELGDEAYRARQRARAIAANAAQLAAWGPEGYVEQRRRAYQACVDKYGVAFTRAKIALATERGRLRRLEHPTAGEAMVRALLRELGFQVIEAQRPFNYAAWRVDPLEQDWSLGPRDAIAEAYAGSYLCDVLLPVARIAVEFVGGVRRLTPEHDAKRRCYLETTLGLTVMELNDEHLCDQRNARRYLIERLEVSLDQALHAGSVWHAWDVMR
jgi:hypothetical protein